MKILVINSGSSSIKYQIIDMENEEVLAKGNYERIGQGNSFMTHKANGEKYKFEKPAKNHEEAVQFLISTLLSDEYGVMKSLDELGGIGHRIVHGGESLKEPTLVTEEVVEEIARCAEFAPLHNPNAVAGIRACQKVVPNVKMVTVFDTGFHQTIPKERYIYPIPYEYYEKYGIRKYGAHGISHQYVGTRIAEILGKDEKDLKIINCHLGQGASISAIEGGKCVETTMGLTPLGGIPMGSRSGDLDPSVVTYIMKKENLTPDEMTYILNNKSGIYGVSEVSLDFRDVEDDMKNGGEKSTLALNMYAYLVASYVAKCAVAMKGVDVITFTAGVGERGPWERAAICDYLKVFGVEIDKERNEVRAEEARILSDNSKVEVWVVPTNEELMIARETLELVK